MQTNDWIPYPENMPRIPKSISRKDNYLVTMGGKYTKNFSTYAQWVKTTDRKGNPICRWEYDNRVNFPWDVIAFMPLPEPYMENEDAENAE